MQHGYNPGKIIVIHHGIDLIRFTGVELQESALEIRQVAGNRRIVFHLARMSFGKGPDVVVRAFKEVKEVFPEAFLFLAGNEQIIDWGETQQGDIVYIKQIIADYGLEDDIMIRFFAREEIPSVYRESAVIVNPSSFHEPFGLVLLEAMATGKSPSL